MKYWFLLALLPLIINCSSQKLGDSAQDQIIMNIESMCMMNRGNKEKIDQYMKEKGGIENSENDWFFTHEEDSLIASHQIYNLNSTCAVDVKSFSAYSTNEIESKINYKKFKKKFLRYFGAEYLKNKGMKNKSDHYLLQYGNDKFYVIMRSFDGFDNLNHLKIIVLTEKKAIQDGHL